jgi:ABC-type transport system involved in multi-copper enzyme maturation permease subunit
LDGPSNAGALSLDPAQRRHDEMIELIADGESWVDRKLLGWSRLLNPILVKETRQAFKSRQFSWTFGLLLLAIALWTMVMLTLLMPSVYYVSSGATLLTGYMIGLIVPTCLIVPLTAYRSMASELEEGTYEVLSVSTISAWQIVVGKIQVAMLQNLVFFSTLAPCVALTYLLRGVPLLMLAFALPMTLLLSLVHASVGVLVATLVRNRFLQVIMLLMLAIVLIVSCSYWIGISITMTMVPIDLDRDFWLATGISWAFVLSYVFLIVLVAAARLEFATSNSLTKIMAWAFVQYIAIVAVFIGICELTYRESTSNFFNGILVAPLTLSLVHFTGIGVFAIAQRGALSERTRRNLPASTLTKLLFSWFNPGGGSAYVLICLSFLSLPVFLFMLGLILPRYEQINDAYVISYGFLLAMYLIFYLGLTRLAMLVVGRWTTARGVLSVVLAVFFVGLGTFGPILISYIQNGFLDVTYEPYMILNPFWSCVEVLERRNSLGGTFALLPVTAGLVFFINLFQLTKDVLLVRVLTPPRVLAELGNAGSVESPARIDPYAD